MKSMFILMNFFLFCHTYKINIYYCTCAKHTLYTSRVTDHGRLTVPDEVINLLLMRFDILFATVDKTCKIYKETKLQLDSIVECIKIYENNTNKF
jgi:hypothetical protein